jgi:SpoVK/Ycf46/Vps4 family AAA+-type ATPase
VPGTWYKGDYEIDIVFLDNLLGKVLFSVADEEEADTEGGKVLFPGSEGTTYHPGKLQSNEKLSEDEIMKEMDEMIGLDTIKQNLRDKYDYLKFLKVRKDKGIDDVDEKIGLHSVFTGNPGTGKTKTALLLGKIYYNLGLLSKGHVYEVDRTNLIGEFVGQTAPKTKEAIKKAKGGILFIDEAYSLAREGDTQRDFGREAIEIIVKEMSDGDGDLAIVVAGYPEEMENFMDSNPGLKSRFNSYFTFPDYNPKELLAIGNYTANQLDVVLEKDAEDYLYTKLVEVYRDRDKTFGNARYVNSLIAEAKMNLGLRIVDSNPHVENVDERTLSTVKLEDLKEIFRKKEFKGVDIPPDEELLEDSIKELNKLVGMENIKNDIYEMVKLVRYYRDIDKDVTKSFSLHTIFTGNPGTGKTTIARIMARIFRALGVLERGHLVEVDREGLIAGYIGQTAIKTAEKIDEAMGGVLFIDEAYSLSSNGDRDDFGKEAIEVILKRMEDRRGEFVVICAGYPEEMEKFLDSNPGLKSRFDRRFDFKDYSVDELLAIAQVILGEQELKMDPGASEHFKKYITSICTQRDKYFGNAREIRKALGEVIKNQNLRLAEIPKEKRTPEMISTITLKDVVQLPVEIKEEKPRFGFEAG